MCGRYNLGDLSWAQLRALMLGIAPESWREGAEPEPIPQRFNVPPTTQVPMIRMLRPGPDGQLDPAMARWGLVPVWHRKPVKEWRAATINARVETVETAPAFRDSYKARRCLVPMAGYYEWRTLGGSKVPFYISPAGNQPAFLCAGLWTDVDLPDYRGPTATILTEPSTGEIAAIHDRQPVMLDAEGARLWLAGAPIADIPRLPDSGRTMTRANKAVGSVKNEGAWLLQPEEGED